MTETWNADLKKKSGRDSLNLINWKPKFKESPPNPTQTKPKPTDVTGFTRIE